MQKKHLFIIVGILALLGFLILMKNNPDKPFIGINGFFDSNGKSIKSPISIVNGIEGVRYITLEINVLNRDSLPLNFYVSNLQPTEVNAKKPLNKIKVSKNSTGSFITDLIDILPYEGKDQQFCATVVSEEILDLRKQNNKTGCITLSILPPKTGQLDVAIVYQNTTTNTTTSDILPPPILPPPSTSSFETIAQGGYAGYTSGTWIKLDTNGDGIKEQYYYASTVSSSQGCTGTILPITTTEGYILKKYSGSSGITVHLCSPINSNEYKNYN